MHQWRPSSSEPLFSGSSLNIGAVMLPSGSGVSDRLSGCGEHSSRCNGWLYRWLACGWGWPWLLIHRWHLRFPHWTHSFMRSGYGYTCVSSLSVVCVLVALLEVCQTVRKYSWSVGWLHLPSGLFLNKESPRNGSIVMRWIMFFSIECMRSVGSSESWYSIIEYFDN